MRIGEINKNNYMEYIKLFSEFKRKKNQRKGNLSNILPGKPTFAEKLGNADSEYMIPGMYITGKDPSEWQKNIKVSDDIKDKMLNLARKEFLNNYGLTDGEERSALIRNYILSIPESQRLSAAWTLDEIFSSESQRLIDIAKTKIPGWQNGQAFDRSFFKDDIQGSVIDTKI